MTSGALISWFVAGGVGLWLLIFIPWELIQLFRRRMGNDSALTASQYMTGKAKAGHRGWMMFIIAFPFFLIIVGIWLVFHFSGLCIKWGWLC